MDIIFMNFVDLFLNKTNEQDSQNYFLHANF